MFKRRQGALYYVTALVVYRQGFTFPKCKEWWRALRGGDLSTHKSAQKFKGEKAVTLFTQQTCWVIAKLPAKVLLFRQRSAGSGEHSRTWYKTFHCRTGDKQQLSVQTCHLVLRGRELCARHPQLLLLSEHRAFMASKQIVDGSFHICGPEAELRRNSLSHEQCLEAPPLLPKKKTKQQQHQQKPNKKFKVLSLLKTNYSP